MRATCAPAWPRPTAASGTSTCDDCHDSTDGNAPHQGRAPQPRPGPGRPAGGPGGGQRGGAARRRLRQLRRLAGGGAAAPSPGRGQP
ncbi:hypothetical protein FCL40_07175 [Ferrimonas sediminicola]|uniref:Uncharacterized protein n=1 Tax=Ferrimonas sediminicola TaxID=2569538 RepID=A0A4U1BIQ3_9GAMM|nr:hypothetical protein FCL40_07175 [Ferrimonas sediminicola]